MAGAPVPLKKSVELYNELVATPPHAMEEAQRLRWCLMKAERDVRGDFLTRVYLMYAHLRCGAPSEARDLALHNLGSYKGQEFDTLLKYAAILGNVLAWEEARDVINWITHAFDVAVASHWALAETATEAALGVGDIAALAHLNPEFHKALDGKEIGAVMGEYQATVRSLLQGRTCFIVTSSIVDEGETAIPVLTHYVAGSLDEAMCLERELDSTLAEVARKHGQRLADWTLSFITAVSPLSALTGPRQAA